jgi:hypothetical protein
MPVEELRAYRLGCVSQLPLGSHAMVNPRLSILVRKCWTMMSPDD